MCLEKDVVRSAANEVFKKEFVREILNLYMMYEHLFRQLDNTMQKARTRYANHNQNILSFELWIIL